MKTFAHPVRDRSARCGDHRNPLRARPWLGQSREIAATLPAATVQPKLTIGAPHDAYEQEADRVARDVVSMPTTDLTPAQGVSDGAAPALQRMCADCAEEEGTLRRQANDDEHEEAAPSSTPPKMRCKELPGVTPQLAPGSQAVIARGTSGGRQLDTAARAYFEPRFGVDFSAVRVHADAKAADAARSVNARAFTLGNHIVFNRGEFSTAHPQGRELLAHELTHVVQQSGARTAEDATAAPRPASHISRQVSPRIQRFTFGAGAAPHPDYGVVPADEQDRVNAAMRIINRMVTDRANFRACHNFYRDNCPGGSDTTFSDQFDNAVVWKDNDPDPTLNGSRVAPDNIAYTDRTFRIGRWAMAAVFIHEMIHTCGQANHDIGDQAKGVCGRLPNI